ncbi:DNA repair protein RecO [bacterium]|nr:DNA repair protein RecO [bacterium]
MPLEQSQAIVLRNFNIGDQDKIVIFLTDQHGIIKGVAKGARKFGNRFGSSLEPMSKIKVFYYEKEKKELVTISNCDLLESFFEITARPETSFNLSYFSELIEEFFPSRSQDELLFRLLFSILRSLKEEGNVDFLSAYFEAWFLKINGVLPDLKKCLKCQRELTSPGWLSPKKDGVFCSRCAPHKKEKVDPAIKDFLRWISKNPPPSQKNLPLPSPRIKNLRKIFQSILIFHMEKEPKSLQYLK